MSGPGPAPAEARFEALPARVNADAGLVRRGLGHFPMSEHPVQFRRDLLPILAQIRAASQ